MEGIERQLRAWLTDRLRSDNTNWLRTIDQLACCHVDPVALAWNTVQVLCREDRLDTYLVDRLICLDGVGNLACNELVAVEVARYCFGGVAAKQAVTKLDHCLLGLIAVDSEAIVVTLFVLNGKDILRDVDQATREITRVGRLEGGIDQPLTSTTRCHEGLQARQPSLEVATHWQLNLAVSSIHLDTDHRTG